MDPKWTTAAYLRSFLQRTSSLILLILVKPSMAVTYHAAPPPPHHYHHYGVNQASQGLAEICKWNWVEKFLPSFGILSYVDLGMGLPATIFPALGNRVASFNK